MRILFFYPSLLSDWNNASASDLRGVAMELTLRGHSVVVYEPRAGDSLPPMVAEYGQAPLARFVAAYPGLASRRYAADTLDLDTALEGANLVVVYDRTAPALQQRLIDHHARCGAYRLLLHARHGTAEPFGFDAVLADTSRLADELATRAGAPVTLWPAAADTRVFKPVAHPTDAPDGDVVWVGNCADDARLDALQEYFLRPVQRLGLRARVYGATFSTAARQAISLAGVQFDGWLPDFDLPAVLAGFRAVVVLPPANADGRPDRYLLPALACGLPVLAAAWDDADHLLHPGRDYVLARDGHALTGWLARVLADRQLAATFALHGRQAVLRRHSTTVRVKTLLTVARALPAAHAVGWSAAFAAAPALPYVTH